MKIEESLKELESAGFNNPKETYRNYMFAVVKAEKI